MIDLTANPKQSLAWHEDLENPAFRRILYDGGARSGKTVLIIAWLCKECEKYPGCRVLIARKNRNAAENSIWKDTLAWMLRGRRGWRQQIADMEYRHVNGSVIRVDGLDDQDRVDKILGTEYDHVFFNEATQLSWATVQTVLSRLAHAAVPVRKAIFDCNPKNRRHWLHRAGIEHVVPDSEPPVALPDAAAWTRRHWTPYDNPFLPTDAMMTLEGLSGIQRRRLLKGEWCDNEGAVYDEFDEDIHVLRGDMPAGFADWRKIGGVDFGFTNPFVFLWGAVDGDGRLLIYRERYIAKQTVRVHAAAIKEHWEPFEWIVADHDAEDRATLSENGIHTIAAKKEIELGIKLVKERLKVQPDGRPRLMIHESCKETIGEFFDYSWGSPPADKNAKEEPVKERDHCLIAGTLITTLRGDIPIETVKEHDFVFTRDGWHKVVFSGQTGENAPLIELKTTDGRVIVGTPEHRVWCENKNDFVQLQYLTPCDTLLICKNQNQSNTTALSSEDTHIPSGGQTACILHRTERIVPLALAGCMKNCGGLIAATFRRDSAYITKTATRSIMMLRILNACQKKITTNIMQMLCPKSGAPSCVQICTALEKKPMNGTDRQQQESFIPTMDTRFGMPLLLLKKYVSNAGKSIQSGLFTTRVDFVPTPVNQRGALRAEKTISNTLAINAENHSQKTDTPCDGFAHATVQTVTVLNRLDAVYDLTVSGAHEFFANGILVHNSMDDLRYMVRQLELGKTNNPEPIFSGNEFSAIGAQPGGGYPFGNGGFGGIT